MHTCKLNWEIAPTISMNYLFFLFSYENEHILMKNDGHRYQASSFVFQHKTSSCRKKKKNMKLGKFIQLKARLYCKYNAALYINDMQPTAPTNSSRTGKKKGMVSIYQTGNRVLLSLG